MNLNLNREPDYEDSEEIAAAALAAVYVLMTESCPDSAIAEVNKCTSWKLAGLIESSCRLKICANAHMSGALASGSNWRFSRLLHTLVVACGTLSLAAVLQVLSTSPAAALERIQYISPAAGPEKTASAPVAKSAPARRLLRVALSTNTSCADVMASGAAQLLDYKTGRILAELPASSRWLISCQSGKESAQVLFSGQIRDFKCAPLLIASGVESKEKLSLASSSRTVQKPVQEKEFGQEMGSFGLPLQMTYSKDPSFVLPLTIDRSDPETRTKQAQLSLISGSVASKQASKPASVNGAPPAVSSYLIKSSSENSLIFFNGKAYRGSLLIRASQSENSSQCRPTFHVINIVDLEDYLLSVLPSEMPAVWNIEALKAQAVAARSYAVANLAKHQVEGYDLKANTEDQVYVGVQVETEASNRAVAETEGLVLKHNARVVSAFFHSAGGGATEQAEHVWGSKVPYLKSVPDFDEESPHFNWQRKIDVSTIEENLRKQGRDIGGLLGIFPLERGLSQRVSLAMIAGTLQTVLVSGEELRKILSLPSTVFNIASGAQSYLLAGRGFGHGLGMSQWGAKYLSEQGYNAAQILSYYYKDVSLDQF